MGGDALATCGIGLAPKPAYGLGKPDGLHKPVLLFGAARPIPFTWEDPTLRGQARVGVCNTRQPSRHVSPGRWGAATIDC